MVNKIVMGIVILGILVVTVSLLMPGPNEVVEVTTTTTLVTEELSDFQITACNAADEGGTCDTKLTQVNLVTKEECCKYLGKCC